MTLIIAAANILALATPFTLAAYSNPRRKVRG